MALEVPRPVIASPTHPIAVFVYLGLALAGIAHAAGFASTPAMSAMWPNPLVRLWGVLLFVTPLACVLSAWWASMSRDPRAAITAEGLSSVTLSLLVGAYEVATFRYRGLDANSLTAQAVYAALALGTLARFIQIDLELVRLRKASESPVTDPLPNGDHKRAG